MTGPWEADPERQIELEWSVYEEPEQFPTRSPKTKPVVKTPSRWLQFVPGSSGTRRDEQKPAAQRAERRGRCFRSNPNRSACFLAVKRSHLGKELTNHEGPPNHRLASHRLDG